MLTIKINSQEISAQEGQSVLRAALSAGIYIPHLCSHPDLDDYKCLSCSGELKPSEAIYQGNKRSDAHERSAPNEASGRKAHKSTGLELGCKLCLVEIKGIQGPQKSCGTIVSPGMEVDTDTEQVRQARQENLAQILSEHPHSCLTCAQSEGCSLTQCSSNVPQNERCCPKFGRCELQKISKYVGIAPATPRYIPKEIPIIETDPLFRRNYNLCIGCLRCVRVCRNLRGVDALGFIIDSDRATVGSRVSSLSDSGCKFCGACVEVCPTGALTDKITVSADRKKSLVPCQGACPVNMDAPNYIRLIKEGKTDQAFEVISHKVPFPSVLGRVCFHPCEENCRRKELNPAHNLKPGQPKAEVMCGASEPIAICGLKRYATENANRSASQPVSQLTGRPTDRPTGGPPIAIIGSGPSGLSAAYYLAQKGYPVTVFEAESEIGGMMRYAIPEYRLPLSALKNDLKKITEHPNITIKTDSRLGRDFTAESLKEQGFKAILIAIGAQSPKKILEGKITAPVLWGIDFLKNIRRGQMNSSQFKNKNILVIGGGNVAIDVALSAKRLGAEKVQMVCLESRDEMPAHEWEIAQALEEGITLNCNWGPKNICQLSENELALEAVQCTKVFDESGRFNPSFNDNVCDKFQGNVIILAIGQSPNTEGITTAINPNRTIKADGNTLATNIPGIFACGEAAHNPSSIIESIADGRKAAENIDNHLGGDGVIDNPIDIPEANHYLGRDEGFAKHQRIKMSCIALSQRDNNFNPVETGFTDQQAKEEANRCLQCDLRLTISQVIFPPEVSKTGQAKEDLAFTEEHIKQAPAKEGVYILLNENKDTILIKGAINIRESLLEQANNSKARFFHYETDPMYTKKESELIQAYLAKYGKLPSGGDELEDLY
ncbi:MAG: FAD-dependent oxidoreductase [Planctomycetes bacterium]|nr:FAD-dependent oxidoreductase [Planctomycetota bacterium]